MDLLLSLPRIPSPHPYFGCMLMYDPSPCGVWTGLHGFKTMRERYEMHPGSAQSHHSDLIPICPHHAIHILAIYQDTPLDSTIQGSYAVHKLSSELVCSLWAPYRPILRKINRVLPYSLFCYISPACCRLQYRYCKQVDIGHFFQINSTVA